MKYILLSIIFVLFGCSSTEPQKEKTYIEVFGGITTKITVDKNGKRTAEIISMDINGDGISDEKDVALFTEILKETPGVTISKEDGTPIQ